MDTHPLFPYNSKALAIPFGKAVMEIFSGKSASVGSIPVKDPRAMLSLF
jgi:hypothetical protein